ncbi:MAG: hypothetical protein ABF285_06840 [Pacificibacter sp.]|uniref:hypothetical protein n=1 Tax=Pacificibacter sp. TaxID=1917866 RepID=UPI00321A8BA3
MNADIVIVVGLLALLIALPTWISAFSENRFPFLAIALITLGSGMVAWVIMKNPGVYTFEEIPRTVTRVIGRFF